MSVFMASMIMYEETRLEEIKLPKFGYLPKMTMTSKGSIAKSTTSIFCERIN